MTYAPTALSWRNSSLPNMRMLLACEVVGNGRHVSSGIHVIKDERSVMVRYIFFFPTAQSCPAVHTITHAIASGMSALRTGAV